jgi:hypothetical protein
MAAVRATGSADVRAFPAGSSYRLFVLGSEAVGLLLASGKQEQVTLRWSWSEAEATVVIDSPSLGVLTSSGHDLSAALDGIRASIEPEGNRILCNESRRDATVSGMLSQSTGGSRVYLLDGVQCGQRPPAEPIFDPAPADLVGTLSEQKHYRDQYFGV